jgi:hypothetical protein
MCEHPLLGTQFWPVADGTILPGDQYLLYQLIWSSAGGLDVERAIEYLLSTAHPGPDQLGFITTTSRRNTRGCGFPIE